MIFFGKNNCKYKKTIYNKRKKLILKNRKEIKKLKIL